MTDQTHQYRAFLSLLIVTLIIALAPILASSIMGKVLPESLIATADKTTTGLITLLGTVGGLLFRRNASDERSADSAASNAETNRILADKVPPQTVTPPTEAVA